MLFQKGQTISSDKIMLPKHQALAKSWDASKQQTWGELTNMAILMTSDLIKQNKFKNMRELYTHMAGMRTLIGAILAHSPDVGKIGRGFAKTPIKNHPDSGYKDLHAEFKSWIEKLRATKDNDNVSLGEDEYPEVTLKGTFTPPDSDEQKEYVRSRIYGRDKFDILHSQDQAVLLHIAGELFKELQENESLDKKAKQKCIEGIYFYLADAMPCARGAGSISQMLFYALENAYTDQMRYLGKMASKFGHTQGVTPDIAAMLSPTLEEFQHYLNNFVIDSDIVVTKSIPKSAAELLDRKALLKDIENSEQALANFEKTLKHTSFGNAQRGTVQPMKRAFEFLRQLAEKSDQPQVLTNLKIFLENLNLALANNPVCYPQFYALLEDKTKWPEPTYKAYNSLPEASKRDESLEAINDLTWVVHHYCSSVGYLYGWNSDTHHVATHYTAKDIIGVARAFKKGSDQGSNDIEQCFATFEYLVNKQKSGFGNGVDEVLDIISIIEHDKQHTIPQEQTEKKIFNKICEGTEIPEEKLNEYHVKDVKHCISSIYEKSEKIKQDLKCLAPIFDSLKLKNEHAADLILPADRKRKIDTIKG